MEDISYMHQKVRNGIKGIIRSSFKNYSEIYKQALEAAVSTSKGPKGGKRYDCSTCGLPYALTEVEVDHIQAVVSTSTEAKRMTLKAYYEAIWTDDSSNLQVLCKPCHKLKTKEEWKQRAAARPKKEKINKRKIKK